MATACSLAEGRSRAVLREGALERRRGVRNLRSGGTDEAELVQFEGHFFLASRGGGPDRPPDADRGSLLPLLAPAGSDRAV